MSEFGQNRMVVLGGDSSTSIGKENRRPISSEDKSRRTVRAPSSSSLEVLCADDNNGVHSSGSSATLKSSLYDFYDSDTSINKRIANPVKQVCLSGAKRKEQDSTYNALTNRTGNQMYSMESSSRRDMNNVIHTNDDTPSQTSIASSSTSLAESVAEDDDDNDEDSGDDDNEKNAPNELMMEFLGCIMDKDYEGADKLCQMILKYEPNNKDAKKFQPLIAQKLQQDAEAYADDGDSGDELAGLGNEDNGEFDQGGSDVEEEDEDDEDDEEDDEQEGDVDRDEGGSSDSESEESSSSSSEEEEDEDESGDDDDDEEDEEGGEEDETGN